ncbi:uncharacterized protein LOC135831532 [Planococcus citri]|uniref:uncharacterized protein LOC135831532 n=1 Tax=Planococcus citri TaxID=170843 RepID=UPI0031F7B36F
MDSLLKPLEEVLQEYSLIELDLELKIKEKLDKIQNDFANINKHNENSDIDSNWEKENDEAMTRNENLLKNLEQTKAKLRSLYCYQPAGDNLMAQIKHYKAFMKKKFSNKNPQNCPMITQS